MPSTFRIASYNVENLFERPRTMNLSTWAEGKPILEQHARINELLNQPKYSATDKAEILDLLTKLGLNGSDEDWLGLCERRSLWRGSASEPVTG